MNRPLLLLAFVSLFMSGCTYLGLDPTVLTTRTETDVMHKQYVAEESTNEPLGTDFGVIKPSSKQTITNRTVTEYDSICNRHYPSFARFGGVELAGLATAVTTASDRSVGNGLLGVYNTFAPPAKRKDAFFNGYLFRLGMWEGRFSGLGKNWTLGTTIVEAIFGNRDGEHTLVGFFPLALKRHIYLREEPPFFCIEPYASLSLLGPSRYLNTGVSAHLGSYNGFNLFTHAGIALGGFGGDSSSLAKDFQVIPYIGLGLSVFDFIHTEKEMDTQWRYQKDNTRRVGLFNFTVLQSTAGTSDGITLGDEREKSSLTLREIDGFILQVANVSWPADFIVKRLTLGTSVINIIYLGELNIGAAILPLRASYQLWLVPKILLEPFAEVNYYPSSMGHLGVRLMLGDIFGFTLGVQAGGVFGNSGDLTRNLFKEYTTDVKGFYFGLNFGVGEFYSSRWIDHFRSRKDCTTPFGAY